MDHSHLFSEIVKRREFSWVLQFGNMARTNPNSLDFSAGFPCPSTFPFESMSITMADGLELAINPEVMATCLQYGSDQGYLPLLAQLKDLTKKVHDPTCWQDMDLIVIAGSQYGIHAVIEMFVNPDDAILVPEFCYPGVFNAVQCIKPKLLPVKCDSKGLIPDDLEKVLANCKATYNKMPKVLYANPSGSNPDGTVWPESRRRLIYEIACKNEFIILEDDPYYFLQYNEVFPPSFLKLDIEGRVIRLDSFSKTLCPGFRLGYATGSKSLIATIKLQVRSTINHVNLITQAIVSELLETISIDGYLLRTKKVRGFYKGERDILMKYAQKHLQGLCEWNVPAGGFFVWLKVLKISDNREMLLERGIKKKLLALPGAGFFVDEAPSPYIRVSFSSIDLKNIDEAFKILAEIIREEIKDQAA